MDGEDGSGRLTLVLTLEALECLADPAATIDDAHRWSTTVGVVGDDAPNAVAGALERADADPDVVSGRKGTAGSLAAIRQRFATDRYVVVGTDEGVRRTAQALGWEYLPLEEAAEKAGWRLADA